ncbi:hypothetical protein BVG16_05810 [Paenibacillus selenitireducens]|uniref:Fimbrial protein n=1 Tax=Paenibacillus selenitireducens TaxID=1324314 RepID=A0A1T2XKA8_9BACL|nr:hypothetical protein [Paenibacillus selenitireducens]OPA80252.1 hypothetical protein BVG16_05810 [Paenibacillus selenitireducens]
MLSEINLLPQREQRSIFFVIGITVILAFGLLSTGVLFFQYQSLKTDQDRQQAEAKTVEKMIEIESQKLLQGASTSEVGQYEQIVHTIEQLPVDTIRILDQLSAALPQSGFFTSYSYQDPGTVSVIADFGTSEDAAQYLYHLTYADWVRKIEISSLVKQDSGIKVLYKATYTLELKRDVFAEVKGAGTE